jgi:hypothetical protein
MCAGLLAVSPLDAKRVTRDLLLSPSPGNAVPKGRGGRSVAALMLGIRGIVGSLGLVRIALRSGRPVGVTEEETALAGAPFPPRPSTRFLPRPLEAR